MGLYLGSIQLKTGAPTVAGGLTNELMAIDYGLHNAPATSSNVGFYDINSGLYRPGGTTGRVYLRTGYFLRGEGAEANLSNLTFNLNTDDAGNALPYTLSNFSDIPYFQTISNVKSSEGGWSNGTTVEFNTGTAGQYTTNCVGYDAGRGTLWFNTAGTASGGVEFNPDGTPTGTTTSFGLGICPQTSGTTHYLSNVATGANTTFYNTQLTIGGNTTTASTTNAFYISSIPNNGQFHVVGNTLYITRNNSWTTFNYLTGWMSYSGNQSIGSGSTYFNKPGGINSGNWKIFPAYSSTNWITNSNVTYTVTPGWDNGYSRTSNLGSITYPQAFATIETPGGNVSDPYAVFLQYSNSSGQTSISSSDPYHYIVNGVSGTSNAIDYQVGNSASITMGYTQGGNALPTGSNTYDASHVYDFDGDSSQGLTAFLILR